MADTDYITKESALSCFHDWIDRYGHEHTADEMVEYQRIENLPVTDVRPVVRGHYIGEYDGYADGNPVYDMWYCSECGCCFEDWDEKPTYNFCPNCGADMREDGTE